MKNIMINRALVIILASFAFACSNPPVVHAKSSAPLSIDYSVPEDIGAGSQVTTTLRFTAKTDIQLVASASAYSGLTLVSGGQEIVINDLKSGETHEMEVTILLDEGVGYLAVYAATTDSRGRAEKKNIAIRYGNTDATTAKQGSTQKLGKDANGETLILMPAEAR